MPKTYNADQARKERLAAQGVTISQKPSVPSALTPELQALMDPHREKKRNPARNPPPPSEAELEVMLGADDPAKAREALIRATKGQELFQLLQPNVEEGCGVVLLFRWPDGEITIESSYNHPTTGALVLGVAKGLRIQSLQQEIAALSS